MTLALCISGPHYSFQLIHPFEFVFFDGLAALSAVDFLMMLIQRPLFTVMEAEDEFSDVEFETSVHDEVVRVFFTSVFNA